MNRYPSFIVFLAVSLAGYVAKCVEEGGLGVAIEIIMEKHVFDDMKAAPDDGVLDKRQNSIAKSGERIRNAFFDLQRSSEFTKSDNRIDVIQFRRSEQSLRDGTRYESSSRIVGRVHGLLAVCRIVDEAGWLCRRLGP